MRDRWENGDFLAPTLVNKLTKRFRCWKTFIVCEAARQTSSQAVCHAHICFIHEAAHTRNKSAFVPVGVSVSVSAAAIIAGQFHKQISRLYLNAIASAIQPIPSGHNEAIPA